MGEFVFYIQKLDIQKLSLSLLSLTQPVNLIKDITPTKNLCLLHNSLDDHGYNITWTLPVINILK